LQCTSRARESPRAVQFHLAPRSPPLPALCSHIEKGIPWCTQSKPIPPTDPSITSVWWQYSTTEAINNLFIPFYPPVFATDLNNSGRPRSQLRIICVTWFWHRSSNTWQRFKELHTKFSASRMECEQVESSPLRFP